MTRIRPLRFVLATVLVTLMFVGLGAQNRDDVALRAAIETETIKGDLKSAIAQFQKLSESKDRAIAATALMHLAACYDRLGQADAQKVYAQVAQQYSDQPLAREAARKLADLGSSPRNALSTELVASLRDDRIFGFATSRDGRYLPCVRGRRLSVLDLVTGQDRVVPGVDGAELPLMSPDGQSIVYSVLTSPARVRIVGVDGTNARDLVGPRDGMSGPIALDVSRDGSSILVGFNTPAGGRGSAVARPRPAELRVVSIRDGSTTTSFKLDYAVDQARFSPDGRLIAFTSPGAALFVLTISSSQITSVAEDNATNPMWTTDGTRLMFSRLRRKASGMAYDLWSVRVANGRAVGTPEFLRRDIPPLQASTADGGYLYRIPNSTRDIYAVDIDPESGLTKGVSRQLTSWDDSRAPSWSPDGQHLAFFSVGGAASSRLGIQDIRTPGQLQFLEPSQTGLQFQPRPEVPAQWFPDGRSMLVLYRGGSLGRVDLVTKAFTPVLPNITIAVDLSGNYPTKMRMSHDGRFLYYVVDERNADTRRIARVNLETGEIADVVRLPSTALRGLAVSHDDKQLAFVAQFNVMGNPPPDMAIMIVPVEGGQPKLVYRTSATAIYDIVWNLNDRRFYYTSGVNQFAGSIATPVGADIWTVSTDGRDAKPLGIHLSDEYYINIHPTGRQLVWMEENYRNELWMLRLPASK